MNTAEQTKEADRERRPSPTPAPRKSSSQVERKKSLQLKRTDLPPPPPPPVPGASAESADSSDGNVDSSKGEAKEETPPQSSKHCEETSGKKAPPDIQSRPLPPPPVPSSKPKLGARKLSSEQLVNKLGLSKTPPPLPANRPKASPQGSPNTQPKVSSPRKASLKGSPEISRLQLETSASPPGKPPLPAGKPSPPKLPSKPPKGVLSQSVKVTGPKDNKDTNPTELTQSLPAKSRLGNTSENKDKPGKSLQHSSEPTVLKDSSDSTLPKDDQDAEQDSAVTSTDSQVASCSDRSDKASKHTPHDLDIVNSNTAPEPSLKSPLPPTPTAKFYVDENGKIEGDAPFEQRISGSKFYVQGGDDSGGDMAHNQSSRIVKTSFSSTSGGQSSRKVTITKTVVSGNKVQKSSTVTTSSWTSDEGLGGGGMGPPLLPMKSLLQHDSPAMKLLRQHSFESDSNTPVPPARKNRSTKRLVNVLSEDSSPTGSKTSVKSIKTTTEGGANRSSSGVQVRDWRSGLKPVLRPAPAPPPKPGASGSDGKVEMRPVRVQVQAQGSITSFTTEDLDLFQGRKHAGITETPEGKAATPPKGKKPDVETRKSRRDGARYKTLGVLEDSKRRSRSVGAPFAGLRLRAPDKPDKPEVPSKPKLPGPGQITPGLGPAVLSSFLDKLQASEKKTVDAEPRIVEIPIVVTSDGGDSDKANSSDDVTNANKPDKITAAAILKSELAKTMSSTSSANENTDKNKNIILDALEIDDPDLDLCVPSDSEDAGLEKNTSLTNAQSMEDIYQEIDFSGDEGEEKNKKTPPPRPPLPLPPRQTDSSREGSPVDKEEEEKLRLKRKFTKKLPRKMSRKYTRRPIRPRVENIYACVDDDEEDALEFSDQDSDNSFEEDSLTDDSDREFEDKMVAKLARTGQTSVTESQVEELVDEIYAERSMSKLQKIAQELLTTERTYVDKLDLVDQTFHFRIVMENRTHHMFPDEIIPQIFSNVKSIYQFHHDFLLPKLEERMQQWHEIPKIGDVMKTFAPFLKLYTEYVQNFDSAMNAITLWVDKSPTFAGILDELQKLPQCGKLSLQHHMLGPIQRVPRYEMLLKDYLKNLPEDSPDREDTYKALQLVTTAASHSNEAMRKIEKFRKLLDINDSLLAGVNLVSPTRELVKEGKIIKISARNGDLLERYLFLFNDLFLLCQSIPIGIKHQYRVKAALDIDGMQVLEGDNLETPNTFYVKSKKKALELHTSSMEEKVEWQVALWNIIADHTRKQMSRKAGLTFKEAFLDEELGKRAPTWIKDQETSMCMQCGSTFNNIWRRRHHCRCCGIVVCGKCSTHKAALQYDDGKPNRVCDKCYNTIMQQEGKEGNQAEVLTPETRTKGVLLVKASDTSVQSGYLHMTCDKKLWQKRYFAVHDNFVLYSFKAHQDVIALTSMPLPGYIVGEPDKKDSIDRDHVFKLFHPGQKKVYFFQAEDKAHYKKWIYVLQSVVQAELPGSPHSSIISVQSTS